MSFRFVNLSRVDPSWGQDHTATCDICCEPDYQDIIDAPLGRGFGVPLRPMWQETGPWPESLRVTVCQKCLMSGVYDTMMAEMVAVAG